MGERGAPEAPPPGTPPCRAEGEEERVLAAEFPAEGGLGGGMAGLGGAAGWAAAGGTAEAG